MKLHEKANLTIGILFTLAIGTLSHFCYDWSGQNSFAALFVPVNESVWEHLKMLFFPVLIYTLFEVLVCAKTSAHFLTSRIASVLLGIFFIPAAFSLYTTVTGKDSLVMDILIFVLAVLLTFFLSRYLEVRCPYVRLPQWLNYAILLLLVLIFFAFTFRPPSLPLFQEPAK